jgi:hypothetical protein
MFMLYILQRAPEFSIVSLHFPSNAFFPRSLQTPETEFYAVGQL